MARRVSSEFLWQFSTVCSLCVCAFTQQVTLLPTGSLELDKYRASRIAIYTNDFGELSRYCGANAGLRPPAAGESRVVFFGDSITNRWPLEDYFPGKLYLNRGIGGQTTPQMLIRFRQDPTAWQIHARFELLHFFKPSRTSQQPSRRGFLPLCTSTAL
jgi:hypothetical protein